ncbi:MAG: hypothetical protein IPN74_15015 [Haliscomenobacter sp.]|nr:hypothetical protein [Haliscomenobacter sp.]MBK8879792.1 hypothetical protein [Haliscomenobacter sp.]
MTYRWVFKKVRSLKIGANLGFCVHKPKKNKSLSPGIADQRRRFFAARKSVFIAKNLVDGIIAFIFSLKTNKISGPGEK